MNALGERDFVELRPGEDLDPFGSGTFAHYMLSWKPSKPGKYTLKLVYDMGDKTAENWRTFDGAPSEAALRRLENTVTGRFESNTVTLVVGE